MKRNEGRTAFVTGGASGIGLAIAAALVGAGVRVAITDGTPSAPGGADGGIDPAIVGVLVINRVRADLPSIVTHGEYRAGVVDRMTGGVAAFDDVPARG